MKNNSVIARRLASQMWGNVQTQKKVASGIWFFSTAGHGGFVVDTDIRPELKEFNEIVMINARSDYYYENEQHFAPFEEDCEYAKVIWLYPEVLKKYSKLYTLDNTTFKEWQTQMMIMVKNSLKNWNLEFLEKYKNRNKELLETI